MIRAWNNHGELIIGLTRKLVERLLAEDIGIMSMQQTPDDCPLVVHIYAGENDEDCRAKIVRDYGGKEPPVVIDKRSS